MSDFFEIDFPIVVNPDKGKPVFPLQPETGPSATGGAWAKFEEWSGYETLSADTKLALDDFEIGVLERPNGAAPFLKFDGAPERVAAALETLGEELGLSFEIQPIGGDRQTVDFSLNFAKIDVRAAPEDGTSAAKWTPLDPDAAPEPFAPLIEDLAALEGIQTLALLLPAVQKAREAADEEGYKFFLKFEPTDGELSPEESRAILRILAGYEDDFFILAQERGLADAGSKLDDPLLYKLTDVLISS